MNKKVLSLIVLFAILMTTLCGCGGKSSSAVSQDNATGTNQTEQTLPDPANVHTVISTPTPEPEPTPEPTPSVEVEWQTLTYQWEDNSGYTFEATVKVSPWINTKNTDYVTAAWNEVGNGKTLPSDSSKSWGNEISPDDNYRPVNNVTDVYYCIGNVTIKNLTTGWDITASAPVKSNPLWFSACQPETDPVAVKKHPSLCDNHLKSSTISKIFYGDGEKKNSTWACLTPQYTSNKWGPVPFVFAHFESKVPAYPDGQYISEITNSYFCVNTGNNWIWNTEMSELTTLKLNVVE